MKTIGRMTVWLIAATACAIIGNSIISAWSLERGSALAVGMTLGMFFGDIHKWIWERKDV